MIIFKYNTTKDKECWKRIIKAGIMFDHKFPTSFNIDSDRVVKAKKLVSVFNKIINDQKKQKDFKKGIKKIYKYNFPDNFICYINTSPYSMDCSEYISISVDRDEPVKIYSTFVHEACHYIFRKYYTNFCYSIGYTDQDIENVKEIITVINNIEFEGVRDSGWRIHQTARKKAKKIWQETFEIKEVIKQIKVFVK